MTKIRSFAKRNVENIRQKNLEDNQLFLKQLLMTEIRNDFLSSARSVLRRKENIKIPVEHEKIEYPTRYHIKVKSGEIPPHVPEWQREIERKKLEKEEQRQERERKREERLLEQELKKIERKLQFEEMIKIRLEEQRRRRELSRWKLLYKDNANPYQRLYKPRHKK